MDDKKRKRESDECLSKQDESCDVSVWETIRVYSGREDWMHLHEQLLPLCHVRTPEPQTFERRSDYGDLQRQAAKFAYERAIEVFSKGIESLAHKKRLSSEFMKFSAALPTCTHLELSYYSLTHPSHCICPCSGENQKWREMNEIRFDSDMDSCPNNRFNMRGMVDHCKRNSTNPYHYITLMYLRCIYKQYKVDV
jgi:hypothetical protein